ncbi:MAG: SDR family oxidoreductase [Burkholderiaceae bacterium]|nr:SDR family oxidoreductase [Burkholderiaceae bacterium]
MKIRDARVVLTGANGGIGRAMAHALVRAGAAVLLVGRSRPALTALAHEFAGAVEAPSDRVGCHAADLCDPAAIDGLRDAAAAWGANVVVHNAGVPSFGRLESLSTADIQRVLDTNLLAPMLLTQALLPHLRRLPQARVICVGSALGRIGLPGFSAYSASKFGLRGFAEALRRELGDGPVQVQYLGPRSTRTGFNSAEVEAYNQATGTAVDTPESVALALLDLLASQAAERFLGFPEKLAVRLNGLAPGLLDGAFDRHRNSLPAPASTSLSSARQNPTRPLITPSSRTET